ncbi:unnamed protein product, partial [Cuscuta epithymum]
MRTSLVREKVEWSWSGVGFSWFGLGVVLTIIASCTATQTPKNGSTTPDAASICANAILIYGYQCQEYLVNTGDGYILSVQRIPIGRSGGDGPRPPVLLQHGLLLDGRSWFYNKPEENLPMILADKGYDVWISNTRGTEYSRRHLYLDPKQKGYWYWTWDHLAEYEIPAVINFVYNATGQKVHYIGHALGSLLCLASFAEGNMGIDRVKSAAFLSPTVYSNHITSPIISVAVKLGLAEMGARIGLYEFNADSQPVSRIVKLLCSQPTIVCSELPTPLTGKNCCINKMAKQLFAKNGMEPTSIRNLKHLSQNVRHGTLEKYDYGTTEANMEHYGAKNPPLYDL